MANLGQDLRYGWRQIRKSPGFAVTAVLTLALGIGATTAIFSFVDGVLLKPLAYRESGRLVVVWERVRLIEKSFPHSEPDPKHSLLWRQAQTDFAGMTLVHEGATGVSRRVGDHPQYVGQVLAEPNLLRVLGVQPALGRDFEQGDGLKGRDGVALISWNLWQSLFGGAADVLGKTFRIAGTRPVAVIGVMPKGFYFPKANELSDAPKAQQTPAVDVLMPMTLKPEDFGWDSDYGNYAVLGRLRPGVSPAAAQAQLDAIDGNIAREAPAGSLDGAAKGAFSTVVQPMKEAVVGRTSGVLWLLLAAVLSVLLIACVNLANAQLARVMARDREAALRVALGASAWSLLQASLVETALLCAAGGLLGVGLAEFAVRRFAGLVQVALPRTEHIGVNAGVLWFSLACTVGAVVLFGALPGLRYLRVRPVGALQGMGRTHGSAGGAKLRRWLIGGQVLACTTLLLLTALFAQSLLHLLHGDKGFSASHVVMATVRLPGNSYTDAQIVSLDDAVLQNLRGTPGAESVGMVSSMLAQGATWTDGVTRTDGDHSDNTVAEYRWISPGYFAVMSQQIVEGRAIDARDRGGSNAVISQATAKAVWPGRDALGRTFLRNGHTYTVVGVAADARTNSLREAPMAMVFLPYWDNPPNQEFFLLKSRGDGAAVAQAMRRAIWSYDPSVTIGGVRTLDAEVSDTLAPERMETTLLACFGGAALLLALLGVYGTLNYAVERRTQEFGIRIALGASRGNVYWITLREVAGPIGLGLVGGWALSWGVSGAVRALLYGAQTADALTTLGVFGVLLTAALVAAYLPCRRASRVEPVEALRAE